MSNRELIWVSAVLAEEYKQLDSVEEQERLVKKVIENKRLDIEAEQELLSESVLLFKSVCLAHRKALQQVYEEQSDLLYKMWEEMGDVSTQINSHVKQLTNQIKPLRNEVEELKKEINSLSLYVPDKFVSVVEQVSNMDDRTKVLLRDVLDMDKQNEQR